MLSLNNNFERDRVRRRRLRLTFWRWTFEGSLGIVPNRITLRSFQTGPADPDWDPTVQNETLYSRLRIRPRSEHPAKKIATLPI